MIIVKPVGGLANRMRVLYAAVLWAKQYRTKVRCIWLSNEELGADFYDIFKPVEDVEFVGDYGKLITTFGKHGLSLVLAKLWNKVKGVDEYFSVRSVDEINRVGSDSEDYSCFFKFISPYLEKGRNVFFSTCDYLMDLNDADLFMPTDELLKVIDEVSRGFGGNTFGMHIRRTDHVIAIKNSPLEAFCNVIEDCLNKDVGCRFFLATDDKNVEDLMVARYKDHIILHNKVFGRNSVDAIKDAVIDMWLLSRTKHIYGSSYSSFSGMSSLIGGVSSTTVVGQ